jgi:probable FeS assembly SUF system protein SufT
MSISTEPVELTRDCEVIQIPAGHKVKLVKGTKAVITQSLGGSYTLLVPSFGGLFSLSGSDADAIGKEVMPISQPEAMAEGPINREELEKRVWEQLKTCYDPEIPVNIVDLGLVYKMDLSGLADNAYRVDVKMTLTAPGCGMGRAIAADAQAKLSHLPGIKQATVEIVWNPPWNRDMISTEGKKKLGIL